MIKILFCSAEISLDKALTASKVTTSCALTDFEISEVIIFSAASINFLGLFIIIQVVLGIFTISFTVLLSCVFGYAYYFILRYILINWVSSLMEMILSFSSLSSHRRLHGVCVYPYGIAALTA